jgi:hypothetical protein
LHGHGVIASTEPVLLIEGMRLSVDLDAEAGAIGVDFGFNVGLEGSPEDFSVSIGTGS